LFAFLCALIASDALPARAQLPAANDLKAVVVLMRHGVRSPTHPGELSAYARQPWRQFDVKPGYLTAHGALLAQQLGEYYRKMYLPGSGCPAQGSVSIWADVDERTLETGKAIAKGFAPDCGLTLGHSPGDKDPLFDPPGVAKVDAALSLASLQGAVGGDPNTLAKAYNAQFAALDEILGCGHATACKPISSQPSTIESKGDGRLASLSGGIDLAATAAENLLLEYTDGAPAPGWGRLNDNRLIEVIQLHAVAKQLEHNRYAGRAHASNLMAHILRELQSPPARVSFIVGHDTQLEELSGMFGLSWLVRGDAMNDTPPGSALVYELHAPANGAQYVRLYFVAQSLDDMRAGRGTNPQRVPVYVPGCPTLDCPIDTFASVVNGAIDPTFVAR
jgi:4-phytase/acid phosphatase